MCVLRKVMMTGVERDEEIRDATTNNSEKTVVAKSNCNTDDTMASRFGIRRKKIF